MLITFMLFTGNAFAAQQVVSLSPETAVVYSDESPSFKLIYNVENGEKKTTGISIRIHYNSKIIESISFSDIYGEGMLGHSIAPKNDTENFDGDASTDKYVVIAWTGLLGNWPAFVNLPGALAKLNVNIRNDSPNSNTNINITRISAAAGYSFTGKSAVILVQ